MASDHWGAKDQTISARNAVAVTPDDNTDLVSSTRGVYVGGTGDISVIMEAGGSPVLFSGVLAGSILPIRCLRVRSTGTTATALVALF